VSAPLDVLVFERACDIKPPDDKMLPVEFKTDWCDIGLQVFRDGRNPLKTV
jgi:hypothetical protein